MISIEFEKKYMKNIKYILKNGMIDLKTTIVQCTVF